MNIKDFILGYLIGKNDGGGGSSVDIEPLSVTENGEYSEEGVAYSPVTVDVPNSYTAGDEGKVVSNGGLVSQTSDTVTENGTVDTTLINSLLVNVSGGGGGNIVNGTFKGTTEGEMDVDLAYSGNGYPIAVLIYPAEGAYDPEGPVYLDERSAPLMWCMIKSKIDETPTYTTSGTENEGAVMCVQKNLSSAWSPSVGTMTFNAYTTAATGRATWVQCCKIRSAKKMSVNIKPATSNQAAFPINLDFAYHVIYSA